MNIKDTYDSFWLNQHKHPFYPNIEIHDVLNSTNTHFKDYYHNYPNGSALIANQQSAGRGRHQHTFRSDADVGLYLSILLKGQFTQDKTSQLTLLSAVALHQTIEKCYGIDANIKWLNDLYLNEKKIAGILVETIIQANGSYEALIVGIGVNIHQQDFPPELKHVASIEHFTHQFVPRQQFALTLLDTFANLYLSASFPEILSFYKSKCLTLKTLVQAENGETGLAVDIDDQGGLIIQTQQGDLKITHGRVQKL